MNICFLGGSFDPPHLGHLAIAKECLKKFDKFIFLPSKQSPHKSNSPFFVRQPDTDSTKIYPLRENHSLFKVLLVEPLK